MPAVYTALAADEDRNALILATSPPPWKQGVTPSC